MPSARSLASVALCVAAATLLGSLLHPGLVVQADEGSFLLNAAAIAGKLRYSALLYDYASGYSFFLAPAFVLFSDFDHVYRATLLINALIVMATPFALYRLTTLLRPDIGSASHVLAAAAASCYSQVLVLGQFALSDNILVPLYAWSLAFAATALSRDEGRVRAAVYSGICAGCLVLVHPRGGPMALSILVACTLPCLRQRDLRLATLVLWLSAIVIVALHYPLEHLAGKSAEHQPFSWSASDILGRLGPRSAWFDAFRNAIGATTYAVVASLGFIVVALRVALVESISTFRVRPSCATPGAVWLACVLGLAACVLTTAIYFTPPIRLDQVVYGRYALPAVVPLVAVGALQFLAGNKAQRLADGAWALGVGGALIGSTALMLQHWPRTAPTAVMPLNIVGLYIPHVLTDTGINWGAVAIWFLAVGGIVHACCRSMPRLGVCLFIAINVCGAIYFTLAYTVPSRNFYASERHVIKAVREFERTTGVPLCVRVDRSLSDWHQMDFATRLFDRIDASASVDRVHCVHAVIAPLESPKLLETGMRLVAMESRSPFGRIYPVGLFIETGATLETFARGRILPTIESGMPLPRFARNANVDVVGADGKPIQLSPGQILEWTVLVNNPNPEIAWPSKESPYPVRLGARAQRIDGVGTPLEYRAELPHSLGPGDTVAIKIAIGPFSSPGHVGLTLGVLQEGVAWFSGDRNFDIEVVKH